MKKIRNNKKTIVRAFVGVAQTGEGYFSYSLAIVLPNRVKQYDPVHSANSSVHRTYVSAALDSCMKAYRLAEKNNNLFVLFYCDDHIVNFEWNVEYVRDHAFSSETEDIDLWKKLAEYVEDHNITLEMVGEISPLTSLNTEVGDSDE